MRRGASQHVLRAFMLSALRRLHDTSAATHQEASPPTASQSHPTGSASPPTTTSSREKDADISYRTLYPRVQLRATTQERQYKRRSFAAFQETEEVEAPSFPLDDSSASSYRAQQESATPESRVTTSGTAKSKVRTIEESRTQTDLVIQAEENNEVSQLKEGNEVEQFLDEVERQVEVARHSRNQTIPFPAKPEANSVAFRRIKKHAKMKVEVADPDYPTFERKDQVAQLPPPREHPWVRKKTPIGPFIVHGDGQINQTGGTGQVDFDNSSVNEKMPESYRGLQHHSILQRQLPQDNGRVLQDAVVKHSFTLTGRGVFTTRPVKKGETIMIVQSTARSVGVKGELERLEEMCAAILTSGKDGDEQARNFLHNWILTGQPSSLLEYWPATSTSRVLEAIGGADTLHALELHPIHIARMAAIIDLNSFLVESSFSERKGMAYFPEAGFLNHSCMPNATYDIMPEHMFRESDYYLDETVMDRTMDEKAKEEEEACDNVACGCEAATFTHSTTPSTSTDIAGEVVESAAPILTAVNKDTALERNAAYFGNEDRLTAHPNLTAADAPVYLFCCRAESDIEAGEEILISYVPTHWTFDNRQYVLHDRYHFWCKCPKCAPVLDKTYARVPKLIVAMVLFSAMLQLVVFRQRQLKGSEEEDYQWLASLSEEQRLEELRARGINAEVLTADAVKRRKKRQASLFELMEEDRLNKLYEPDNRGFMNIVNRMDPNATPPR